MEEGSIHVNCVYIRQLLVALLGNIHRQPTKEDNNTVTYVTSRRTSKRHELSTHGEQICFIVLGFTGIHFFINNYLFI